MQKRFLLVLLFSIFISFLPAQSLDTTSHYAKALKLAKERKLDEALTEARKSLDEPVTDSLDHRRTQRYLLLGKILYNSRKLPQAIDTLAEGLKGNIQDSPYEEMQLYYYLGTAYLRSSQVDSAQKYLLITIDLNEKGGYQQRQPNPWNVIGNMYLMQGDYAQALENFNFYIELIREKKDPFDLGAAYINISTVHMAVSDFEQAEKDLQNALEVREVMGDSPDLAIVYDMKARLFTKTGELRKAKKQLELALTMQRKIGDINGEGISLSYLSRVYEAEDKYELAIETMRKRLSLTRDNPNNLTQNYRLLANLLAKSGQQDSAAFYFQEAILIADTLRSLTALSNGLKEYYLWQKEQEDAAGALATHERLLDVFKEQYLGKSAKELARERARFKTKEAESEVADLSEENETLESTNALYAILLTALAVLLAVVVILLLQLRRVKKKLEVQNLQLVQLVEAKNRFFSIIAHDLRSPLVAFQNIGKRIQKAHQQEDSERVERLTEQLDHASTQLNGLLNNLLSWALLQNGLIQHRPESIPVTDIVLDNLDLFDDLCHLKQIQMQTDIEAGLVVTADENALNLMIRNLLSNAIKFTPEGGKIRIESYREKGQVMLRIKDSGTGIPEEKLQSIFELREGGARGTKGEKGTGLGLYLVNELIEVHRGKIRVQSILGKGSTFTLAFPE